MRTRLVLTLMAGSKSADPGFGWDGALVLRLYGTYAPLIDLTLKPVAGWPTIIWTSGFRSSSAA
jgi:hypothetical protein